MPQSPPAAAEHAVPTRFLQTLGLTAILLAVAVAWQLPTAPRELDTILTIDVIVVLLAGGATIGLSRPVKRLTKAAVLYQPDDAYALALLLLLGPRLGVYAFMAMKAIGTLFLLDKYVRIVRGTGDLNLRFTKWIANLAGFAVSSAAAALLLAWGVDRDPSLLMAITGAIAASLVYIVVNTFWLGFVLSRAINMPYVPVTKSLFVDTFVEEARFLPAAPVLGITVWLAPAAVPIVIGGLLIATIQRRDIYVAREELKHLRELLNMSVDPNGPLSMVTMIERIEQVAAGATNAREAAVRPVPPVDNGREAGVLIGELNGEDQWVVVSDKPADQPFTPADRQLLESIAVTARRGFEAAANADRRNASADHDALTGMLNRYGIEQELARLNSSDEASVIVFDLDRFENFNRVYGPDVGNSVLATTARRIADLCPNVPIARFDDRFVVLLSDTPDDVKRRAEEVIGAIRTKQRCPSGIRVSTSATAAVITFRGDDEAEKERIFRVADKTLTDQKREKRGTVKKVVLSGWGSAVMFKDLPEVTDGPPPTDWSSEPLPDVTETAADADPEDEADEQDRVAEPDSDAPADSDGDSENDADGDTDDDREEE